MNRPLVVSTLVCVAVSAIVACSSSDSLPARGTASDAGVDASDAAADAAVPETVRASDYDQTCATNDDCALVVEASVCAVCTCENAAVRVEEKAAFVAARQAQTCPNPNSGVMCGACQSMRALCESATCTAGPNDIRVLASDFPGACTTAADCLAVHEGDACDACQCPNAAIPKSQEAAFTAAKAGIRCGTPAACAADCMSPEVACVEQKCTLLDP